MNILKDIECPKCQNSGFYINSLGVYIVCPVCRDSRAVRILKDNLFKLLLRLFKLSSDALNKINWASEDTIRFERLYNVELEGKIEERQEMPFESYEQVFENGNEVLKNKIAYKIITSYITGYTERKELVGTALEVLTGSQDLLVIAEQTHNNATLGKDTREIFYQALNEASKN
jgi:hypothetical protein